MTWLVRGGSELSISASLGISDSRQRRVSTALVDRYRSQAGNPDGVDASRDRQDGLAATVEALREARVDTLLLRDDPRAGGTLFTGPEPTHVALEADTLTALGVSKPRPDRADAVLVRALAGTDARLLVLDDEQDGAQPELADGIGFVARF